MPHKSMPTAEAATLARRLADLRYDSLATFLHILSGALRDDALADEGRKRVQLAAVLNEAGNLVGMAAVKIDWAWRLSEDREAE